MVNTSVALQADRFQPKGAFAANPAAAFIGKSTVAVASVASKASHSGIVSPRPRIVSSRSAPATRASKCASVVPWSSKGQGMRSRPNLNLFRSRREGGFTLEAGGV